jgi:hypothetical protein
MQIKVQRILSNKEESLGIMYLNGVPFCWVLEDQKQAVKVKGETRIPEGEYEVKLRTVGGHHESYAKKYPAIHKGMLELQNVPGFQFILIHIGNTDKDTDGCLLVGEMPVLGEKLSITQSTAAYERFYKRVITCIEAKEKVTVKIEDIEKK